MNNPLEYFENLLSSDQSESKKQFMISDFLDKWSGYGEVKKDIERGIIEQEIHFFDEVTKTWSQDVGVLTFESYFQQEIDKEYKQAITSLSHQILEISSKSTNPEIFINQIQSKIYSFKIKSDQYYPSYPFVKEALVKIDDYLKEYFALKTENIITPNTILRTEERSFATLATQVITNYSSLSFKWDLMNPEDVESELSRLYELLTANPSLIDCDKQDFINGFSQREVIAGINWMVMAKNKTCSKSSLFYLLSQLIEKSDLMDEPDDFNKKIEYVFRDNLGQRFSNIKQSKSQMSDNPAQKERIDEIIESFLQV